MSQYLVASGSRRITQLTTVSGISGSTSMPIVMGGSTVQVSHTDFLNSTVFNRTLLSGSAQVVQLLPNGTVSGSAQVSFNGIIDKPTLVSSSQQVLGYGIFTTTASFNAYTSSTDDRINSLTSATSSYATTSSNRFIGNQTITGSLLITGSVNIRGGVTGSSFTGSFRGDGSGLFGVTSTLNTGSFATTGSNTFRGNQIVSASVDVSGSVNADRFTLDASLTSNISALNTTFNFDLSGSESVIINKSLVLGDGKILVAGKFQSIDAHTTPGIARFNSNGSIDTSFSAPTIGAAFIVPQIYTFVTQSDGKIIVGGDFNTVNGVERTALVRLNTNGVLDNSFAVQSWGSIGEVRDIVIQNDGKIVCVGSFTSGSRRINTDGTLDTTYNVSTGNNQPSSFNNGQMYSVGLLTSGSEQAILIGGDFQQWGSYSAYNNLVKLNPNGSLDFGFAGANLDIATISGDRIGKIKVGDDGYIYVAGRFRDTTSSNHAGFGRITTVDEGDGIGALDNGFRTYITNSFVNDFDFYGGDKILLGGNFTTIGNPAFSITSANRFVIVNYNNGARISNWFSDGLASTYFLNTGSVNSVTLLPNNNVLVGGTFTQADFTAREGLASLKLTGFGDITTTTDYSITADTTQLLISSSNTHFSGDVNITGSLAVTETIKTQILLTPQILTGIILVPNGFNGLLTGPVSNGGDLTIEVGSNLAII